MAKGRKRTEDGSSERRPHGDVHQGHVGAGHALQEILRDQGSHAVRHDDRLRVQNSVQGQGWSQDRGLRAEHRVTLVSSLSVSTQRVPRRRGCLDTGQGLGFRVSCAGSKRFRPRACVQLT